MLCNTINTQLSISIKSSSYFGVFWLFAGSKRKLNSLENNFFLLNLAMARRKTRTIKNVFSRFFHSFCFDDLFLILNNLFYLIRPEMVWLGWKIVWFGIPGWREGWNWSSWISRSIIPCNPKHPSFCFLLRWYLFTYCDFWQRTINSFL